jgi:cobyrinic acid a,c-diamide synthase
MATPDTAGTLDIPRYYISAAHKSSGKTTVSIGLCAALHARGLAVQPFKKGPDFIDPMWLAMAAGRICRNLDFHQSPDNREILAYFSWHAEGADISAIEGNKGLYDGLDIEGSNSNAAMAKLLEAPVILVIDARGMTRGIAPLVLGYQAFDRDVRIAGVILNRLGGSRHESKLRAVLEHYTDVTVLGGVHEDPDLAIVERHLGLMPSNEAESALAKVRAIGERVSGQVDVDGLLRIARTAPALPRIERKKVPGKASPVRIGVLRDRAFGFYYPDDLEALERAGAKLVFIDALRQKTLPALDGLLIGGGFPECFIPELEANADLRHGIRTAIEEGLPVYAECGGLMYLARSLRWKDKIGEMVGTIPADVVMHERPVGRGYARLRSTGEAEWMPKDALLPAHEFHYSGLENLASGMRFAFDVERGFGIDGRHDGIVYKNLLASYAHLRNVGDVLWAEWFVAFVREGLPRLASESRAISI